MLIKFNKDKIKNIEFSLVYIYLYLFYCIFFNFFIKIIFTQKTKIKLNLK